MIVIGLPLDLTRLCGMAAYGSATLVCLVAWTRTKRAGAALRLALMLALADTVLFLDITFNWRWMLHQFFVNTARGEGVYGRRHGPQEFALVLLLGAFVVGCTVVALRRIRGRPGAVLAAWGVILAVSVWLVEVISLHRVDHILYHRLGPLLPVSFLWIASCLMTSVGMLAEMRRMRASNQHS